MKMKKILAAVLLAAMLLTLAACGEPNTGKTPSGGNNGGNEGETGTGAWGEFKTANTTKTVLTADNGCVVTISPVEYANDYVELRVNFRNNTDAIKSLELAAFSVNGMMIEAYMSFDAEVGKESSDMFGVSESELRMKGIFQIATIDLLFTIRDEYESVEEVLSCQLKTNAEDYAADPEAYLAAITSQKGQEELKYTVKDSVDERTLLGEGVYLESEVYVQGAESEMLLLEVVNENEDMRYVRISAETVNGMNANGAGQSFTVFPKSKAIISIDMEWALAKTLRQAFGMQEVSQVNMFTEVYLCDVDGSMDWSDDGEQNILNYTVPDTSARPDLSGTVLYEENGLKITAKAPVVDYYDEDYAEHYVYLIFENVGERDLYIRENDEKEVVIDGGVDTYYYFDNPGYLYMDDFVIGYVEVDNMEGEFVFLPLTAEDNEDISVWWEVDLTIMF